jgi:hypothetical protein
MSHQSDLDLISGSESLPDLPLQKPFGAEPDCPTVMEVEQTAADTKHAIDLPTQASRASGSLDGKRSVPNIRKDSAPSMLGQKHLPHNAGPVQTDSKSGGKSTAAVAGLQDCVGSTKRVPHTADNGSIEVSTVAEPCRHLSDGFSGHQDVAGQRASVPPSALECMTGQPSPAPKPRSSGWMLHRWHAQPPSEEPYTPIEEVCCSRVTKSFTLNDGKKSRRF